jgi:hydrogen cyanide synthase HcnC
MDFKFEKTGLKFVIYDDEDRLYAEHIVACIPHLADQVRWLDQAALREAEPSVSHEARGALEFLCDHQVSPFRLADAYTEGARQNGVDLYFNTNVTGELHHGSQVTGVQTSEAGVFRCDTLINATGAWAAENLARLPDHQRLLRGTERQWRNPDWQHHRRQRFRRDHHLR